MEFNFKSYDNSKQSISYCEVDKCPVVIKLQEQLEAYKMEAEEGKEINAELKAENEKIEQCIIEQNRLVVGMTKEIETLTFKKYELLQTLTEIEKLAIQGNVYCIDYNIDDCEKCIKQSDCKITLFKQILQIISEVEDV